MYNLNPVLAIIAKFRNNLYDLSENSNLILGGAQLLHLRYLKISYRLTKWKLGEQMRAKVHTTNL